ncbi:MAG: hypothetical protein Q8M16_04910 [Pirellulaceae bacterium]|nr:hypothetical protein [Pirellulaceae bacterium]
MNPLELIKSDLTPDEWDTACQSWREPIQELRDQCPFARHRLFIIHGRTKQFDFPTLPHGSYGYYAANGRSATRLTRENKEIHSILSDEWAALAESDPVCLASLILKFYDAGIKARHHVLKDADDLRSFGNPTNTAKNYELNDKEFSQALPRIGSTAMALDGAMLSLRAVTLCGWMHDKQNLGVEWFTISSDGTVSFRNRDVLSKRIFRRTPSIRY